MFVYLTIEPSSSLNLGSTIKQAKIQIVMCFVNKLESV